MWLSMQAGNPTSECTPNLHCSALLVMGIENNKNFYCKIEKSCIYCSPMQVEPERKSCSGKKQNTEFRNSKQIRISNDIMF